MNRPYGDSESGRHRQSIRLQGFDYSQAGAYFVTVCTRDRECLFGDVVNGEMQLNGLGSTARSVWHDLPKFYEHVELDEFVVMPNHVHGIVMIGADVGAIHESPSLPADRSGRRRMLLSKIVGRFKMVSAKQVNGLRETPGVSVWQRNYYEHIVRDDESLTRIRQYIADNPAQWEFDQENPDALRSEVRGNS